MNRIATYRSLRVTLSMTITALIIVVSLSILAISYGSSVQSLLIVSEKLSAEISKGIIEKIDTLLNAAETANATLNLLVASGTLDPTDGQRTTAIVAGLVFGNEGFSSVEIGLPEGSKYKAERTSDGSITRQSDIRTRTNVLRTYISDSPDSLKNSEKNSVKSLEEGYDARKRPWFKKAVGVGKMAWTDMFVAGTSKQLEYGCVIPIYGKDHTLLAVAAVNIKLVTLSQFLNTLRILDHGRAFVVNERGQVIAIPIKSGLELDQLFKRAPEGSEEPFELYPIEELPDRDIRQAVLSYRRDQKTFFQLEGQNGDRNVVSMVKHPFRQGTTFTIGIIFPESDLTENISRNTRYMLLGVLAFLLLALLVGSHIAKRISNPLAILAQEVDKVSRLELDSNRVVESRILEVARIDESVRNMKLSLRSFKKYVPLELVMQLNEYKKEAALEGEKRELSIFFSDIADFTSISEQLTPEDLVRQLGTYFDGMSRIVLDNAGTLDKYIGDAIMAFWGAPLPRANHASLACGAALACQRYLDSLAAEWVAESKAPFHTRIGIHTGKVIVGNIGTEERMNYSIIGDAANLASRLEGLNKLYRTRVIISEDTFSRVQSEYVARKLDRVAVKGRSQGVLIYELLCARGEVQAAQKIFLESYDRAVELYLTSSWAEAKQAFAEAQKLSPLGDDYPSELLSARCEEFMRDPPGPQWNDAYMHNSK